MTPIVGYASKMVFWAAIFAGLLGESVARMTVLGFDVTGLGSLGLGGVGLFLVGVRLRLDNRLIKRERKVSFEEGYLHGLRDAVDPGPTPSPETIEALEHDP